MSTRAAAINANELGLALTVARGGAHRATIDCTHAIELRQTICLTVHRAGVARSTRFVARTKRDRQTDGLFTSDWPAASESIATITGTFAGAGTECVGIAGASRVTIEPEPAGSRATIPARRSDLAIA